MAKQRQDFVSARLMQLKNRLADLSLINMKNIPKDRIAFGSKVTLYDVDRDVEIEYRLVTSEEADVSKGLISTTSPIGRGLMGKKAGDDDHCDHAQWLPRVRNPHRPDLIRAGVRTIPGELAPASRAAGDLPW